MRVDVGGCVDVGAATVGTSWASSPPKTSTTTTTTTTDSRTVGEGDTSTPSRSVLSDRHTRRALRRPGRCARDRGLLAGGAAAGLAMPALEALPDRESGDRERCDRIEPPPARGACSQAGRPARRRRGSRRRCSGCPRREWRPSRACVPIQASENHESSRALRAARSHSVDRSGGVGCRSVSSRAAVLTRRQPNQRWR